MDNTTDQTNFWLAWQATCAAVKCIDRDALEKACAADPNKYASVLRYRWYARPREEDCDIN